MGTPSVLDLDTLLAPVSEEQPTGIDIREDASPTSPYYSIKDARGSARAAERNNLFDANNNEANEHWRTVLALAPQILQQQTKDLEVACWYIEALTRTQGFAGLRDGIRLVKGLVDDYWDDLFPLPDEDGLETRVAPLTGLNGEGAEGVLIPPLRNIPLTNGQAGGPYTYWQYQQALDNQKISDESVRSERIEAAGFSLADIEQAVAGTSGEFYSELRDEIEACAHDYRALSQALDERCGIEHSPPTSNIVNTLEDCLGAVKHLAKDKLPSAEEELEGVSETPAGEAGAETPATAAVAGGPIRSREDAFNKLVDISEFFRRTEPHSPLSYMLEKAVRWGKLPLSELMRELIPDNASREHYSSLTGVKLEDE